MRQPPKRQKGKVAPKKSDTSWGHVANWYHEHVSESDDTYHEKVIKPNLLRLLGDVKGKLVLDVACGQGLFSPGPPRAGGRGGGGRHPPGRARLPQKTT